MATPRQLAGAWFGMAASTRASVTDTPGLGALQGARVRPNHQSHTVGNVRNLWSGA